MIHSAEIRWFFENKLEFKAIEQWFNDNKLHFAGNWERADLYLRQPGLKKLGVKIREGKVEVKILLADSEELAFTNNQAGLANEWVKYSFSLQESDAENKNLLQQFTGQAIPSFGDLWTRVDKERLLRKFSIDLKNNSLTPIPADAWPEEGCGVELTKISVNQQTFYTFGLEAFSKARQEPANLKLVLNHIISEMPAANLRSNQSYSYPSFLATLYSA